MPTALCRVAGAPTPGLFGFHNPETTPSSIPTTSRTAPVRFLPVVARGASFRQQRRQRPPGASEANSRRGQSKQEGRDDLHQTLRGSIRVVEVVVHAAAGLRAVPDWRSAMPGKVRPDPEDYAQIEREYGTGTLPPNAATEEQAERYRLAQAAKLIRLYGKETSGATSGGRRADRKANKK